MNKLIALYCVSADGRSIIVIRNESATEIPALEGNCEKIIINGSEIRILGIKKKTSIIDQVQYFLLLDTDIIIESNLVLEL